MKILIIDDDDGLRLLAKTALSQQGHSVLEAKDGEAGLAALEKESADLIFCDLRMPGMGGEQVLKEIRGMKKFSKTPVVMLSADPYPEAANAFTSVLRKPLGPKGFCEEVHRWEKRAAPVEIPPETLDRLKSYYAQKLPGQIDEMEKALEGDVIRLRNLAHSCAGAGGSFGMDWVTEIASVLEKLAEGLNDLSPSTPRHKEFQRCARELIDLMRENLGGSDPSLADDARFQRAKLLLP